MQSKPRGDPVEWFLVGLARQQRSFSIYVNAVLDGAYLLERYAGRLGTVKTGAASISFGGLDDVDVDELKALLSHAHDVSPEDGAAPAV